MSRKRAALVAALAVATGVGIAIAAGALSARAQMGPSWHPKWTAKGELVLPSNHHQWVFLGSPLTPNALNGGAAGFPEYHNVYVQPEAFRIYRETGDWPEGTIMFKELQLVQPGTYEDGSRDEASGRGYFPAKLNGVDISVKDSERFKDTDGWGFFTFGHEAPPYPKTATVQPAEACASCHQANATNMVFSKFYAPILNAK